MLNAGGVRFLPYILYMYIAVMWHRIENPFCRFEDRSLSCQKILPFDTATKKNKKTFLSASYIYYFLIFDLFYRLKFVLYQLPLNYESFLYEH